MEIRGYFIIIPFSHSPPPKNEPIKPPCSHFIFFSPLHQTMTVSTAIVSEHTTAANRSAELSKLSAASTFSFIVAPTIGSFLYSYSKKLPPMV